jgi:hypothetical protein
MTALMTSSEVDTDVCEQTLAGDSAFAPPLSPGAGAAQTGCPAGANAQASTAIFRPTKGQDIHHALYAAMTDRCGAAAYVRKEASRLRREAAELRGQLLHAADDDERLAIRADLDACTTGIEECEALAREFEREREVHRRLAGPLLPSKKDIEREAAAWAAWWARVQEGTP